ncbi:DNA-directed RNA polymerases II, IV and V subunit 8B [Carex littledalei]|uniref:DNA-directed RNA polymerases II, IV and V subunit 8B n=1 Tax=Carex littledalei TaxID=544730 RepID=A0A833RIG6_9POAL|nr:DNA-directed RNA polymerases II, IV and V subunit 8B [Carex littledalei]
MDNALVLSVKIMAVVNSLHMFMQLDINTESYPTYFGKKSTMVLSPTYILDSTPDDDCFLRCSSISLLPFY